MVSIFPICFRLELRGFIYNLLAYALNKGPPLRLEYYWYLADEINVSLDGYTGELAINNKERTRVSEFLKADHDADFRFAHQ